MDEIPTLTPAKDDVAAERASSIFANEGYLSVKKQNGYVPIAYDIIDGIDCNGIKSHKAVLALKPVIANGFPTQDCNYIKDTYLAYDRSGVELERLPKDLGDGFYQKYVNSRTLVNAANGSLGDRKVLKLKVGLGYVRGTKILTGERASDKMKK